MMRTPRTLFTSPLAGEVVRRSDSEGGREGGIFKAFRNLLPPSLTLPRKGGGNMLCLGRRK